MSGGRAPLGEDLCSFVGSLPRPAADTQAPARRARPVLPTDVDRPTQPGHTGRRGRGRRAQGVEVGASPGGFPAAGRGRDRRRPPSIHCSVNGCGAALGWHAEKVFCTDVLPGTSRDLWTAWPLGPTHDVGAHAGLGRRCHGTDRTARRRWPPSGAPSDAPSDASPGGPGRTATDGTATLHHRTSGCSWCRASWRRACRRRTGVAARAESRPGQPILTGRTGAGPATARPASGGAPAASVGRRSRPAGRAGGRAGGHARGPGPA
jgi:hypothetical protein